MLIDFTSTDASLENAGGKGANLARLSRAGFNVPPGFIISTEAYRSFVRENQLDKIIKTSISGITSDDPAQLENASTQIRSAFSAGQVPSETKSATLTAYAGLNGAPVAVRSSATAEDLPDLSFAGQQDTFLNITSEDDLFRAVVGCWSSLWTARAIGYRSRNAIDHGVTALAVVVQQMVQSEVSGVLFTANPLTGQLRESVIDATFGLGEALVSGQVEPDHYVVNALSGAIISKSLGEKSLATRSLDGGGVETVAEQAGERQTLSEREIQRLVELGRQVQSEYDSPQDIEWAITDDAVYLLQSRPITSLFPVPELSFDPLQVWVSFGSIQGLVGPMTPLGRDVVRHIAAGAGGMFGLDLHPDEVKIFEEAGERIWVRFSDAIRNPIAGRILMPALNYVEPSARQIIQTFLDEPNMRVGKGKIRPRTLVRVARFGLPVAARLAYNLLRPEKARAAFDARTETVLADARIAPGTDRFERLANIVSFIRQRIAPFFTLLLPEFVPMFGPSMASLNVLYKFGG